MKQSIRAATAVVACGLVLAGCGGTKILKHPDAFNPAAPLASGADAQLAVTLDWVVVRDGPGTWARSADWDEYLLTVHNRAAAPLAILSVTVIDSLGETICADQERSRLVKASRRTSKRYKGEGIEVKAGASSDVLLAAGAIGGAVAYGAGATLAVAGGSSAMAAGALGGLVIAPVLVVGALVKSSNEKEVAAEIRRRHAALPIELQAGESRTLALFFPLAPAPRSVELLYAGAEGPRVVSIDTGPVLTGLHLAK